MKSTLLNKKIFRFISVLALFVAVLMPGNGLGQTVQTFTTSGSWTVPCGVTSVTVQIWGGGGAGGGDNSNGGGAGAGGGSGAYSTRTITVSSGDIFNYTIGAGGVGAASVVGGNGSATTFTGPSPANTFLLTAPGGLGGNPNNGAGGAGASIATGGTTNNAGVAGSTSGATNTGGTGAGAPNGGGNTTGPGQNTNGNTGSNYGGGGSGGGGKVTGSGLDSKGGNGASGAVILTFTTNITIANAGPDQNTCNAMTLAGNTPDATWCGQWSVVSGTATITAPGSCPGTQGATNSGVTAIPSGTCATIRWTMSKAGCTSSTDDVILCVPAICNDDPCNATLLTVVNATNCTPAINLTNTGSTYSTGMPDPPCGYVNGTTSGDVWYSAVVPADGQLQVTALGGGTFDPMVSIYDGACGSLQSAGCADPVGYASNAFPLTYAGTPGSTIYIRVNESLGGDATTGSFGLCAYTTNTGTVSQVLPGVTTTVTCGSTLNFYDSGGQGGTTSTSTLQPPPAGNYTNNTGTIWKICPSNPTQYVQIQFNQFLLESGFDKMTITSGTNNIIAQWTGNEGAGDIVTSQAPGQCLTIYFQSDYSFTALGWEAVVSCTSTMQPSQINNESSVQNCTGNGGVWVCADGTYNTAAGSGAGIDEINEVTGGCWGAAGEVATSWFYFTTASSGSLAFQFVPSNSGHNINFALYGPSTNGVPPCPLITGDAPIRCSFADIGGANTGLQAGQTDSYDGNAGYGGNGFAEPVNVIAGQTYALAIDVYQNGQPPTQTTIDFTGVAALACNFPLPITLSDFSGINQGRTNLLNWIVASQSMNDYFSIERSVNGTFWEIVGTVDGAGTTQTAMFYSMVDKNPYFPTTYYRLKQTDYDGNFEYSDMITIKNNKNADADFIGHLAPNPTSDFATFIYSGFDTETPLNVTILNQMGAIVQNLNHVSLHKDMALTIRTHEMGEGLYQVIFTQGDQRQVQKISIVR